MRQCKTGIVPINRTMVDEREVVERHPWLVLDLVKAFDRANDMASNERVVHAEDHLPLVS